MYLYLVKKYNYKKQDNKINKEYKDTKVISIL